MSTLNQQKKLTILLDSEVYDGLYATYGRGNIGSSINDLLRPLVCTQLIEDGYKQMAQDEERERLAHEWLVGSALDIPDENIWQEKKK